MVTLVVAVIVLSIVWGGFAFFLLKAIKFEKRKNTF